jgi:phage gp16-like protein
MAKGEMQAVENVFAHQAVGTWASRHDFAFVEDVVIYESDESLTPMADLIRCAKNKAYFSG